MSENNEDPTLKTLVLDELPDDGMSDGDDRPTEKPATTTEREEDAPQKPDDLRAAMAELAGTVRKIAEPKLEVPQPPSPAEVAEYWAVWDPEGTDKEFFKKFGRFPDDTPPEQIAAFRELFGGMTKGLMRQAVTAAKNYIAMERARIDQDYGPLKEYVETQKREAVRTRFFDGYPALSEKKFQKIIDATARTLDNKTFDSEEAYFKALAEGAAGSIKDILPDFDLGAKPTTKQPGKTPKLPRTTAGGGGGAGKGAAHNAAEFAGQRNDIDSLEDGAE